MSAVENTEENKVVNIEGILADFFLKKMNSSKSESEGYEKKRKKNKKHKSKKSKHKRNRSHSSDEKSEYMNLSSSEEKDIKRLQRLKRLDTKESLNVGINATVASGDSISKIKFESPKQDDIYYGPTLETLLGIATNDEDEKKMNTKVNDENKTNAKSCGDSAEIDTKEKDIKINSILNTSEITGSITTTEKDAKATNLKKVSETIGIKPSDVKNSTSEVIKFKQKKKTKKYSRSKSRSRSVSSEKHSKSYKSKGKKHLSRSRSNSKCRRDKRHKSRSRSNSKSRRDKNHRSRSRSHSRHRKSYRSRSKEYNGRYKSYSRRSRNRSLSKNRKRSSSRSRRHRSRSRSYERSRRSLDKDSKFKSSKRGYNSEHNSSRRNRSRSKSSDKRSTKIDQAKIREIAEKNVLSMIEKGTLPQGLSLDNFKKDQLVSLKSGGKSVQELTDFCTELSKRENDPVSENKNGSGNNTEAAFIHHPFKIKEVSTIKLNIKNSVQIPIKTHAEKVAETCRLSSQFPVSSGNKHKQKELEWIPVEPTTKTQKDTDTTKALVPLTKPAASVSTVPEQKISIKPPEPAPSVPFTPPLPPEAALPAPPLPPLPPPLPPSGLLATVITETTPQQPHVTLVDYPIIPTNSYSYVDPSGFSEMSTYYQHVQYPNMVPVTEQTSVLPTTSHAIETPRLKPKKPVDVSTVIAQRFKALTKLQTNPNDIEALQALEDAQASINDWVQSQEVPGLFTGSTGAKLLSVEELSGPRHWNYRAKKDFFIRAAPVTEGKGMSLLKKMGWNPGEGLGKNKEGSLEPLVLDIKTDKKGLVSEGEGSKKMVSSILKDLQGKHPVSALMELCSKRKWKPPLYTLVQDSGPSHKKLFLYKVEVNSVEYQAATPTSNKKIAKADAAVICLQALSVFPKS